MVIKHTFKQFAFILIVLGSLIPITGLQLIFASAAGEDIKVWWPVQDARLQGTQPFKAIVEGVPLEQYEMFWQVDGGSWVWMDNNYKDYPHKEASVDVSSWNWRGNGPYEVGFIARKNGTVIAEQKVTIYVGEEIAPAVVSQPLLSHTVVQTERRNTKKTQELTQEPAPVEVSPSTVTVSKSTSLWVDPNSPARRQADEWRTSRPQDAAAMDVLAAAPTGKWLGGWSGDVEQTVRSVMQAAGGKTPIFIAYNVPGRDCGGYSAGGVQSSDVYLSWVRGIANGIGSGSAIVILEPDALANMTCLSGGDQDARLSMLARAVTTLKQNGNTKVYLDAGHSNWNSADTMAGRLKSANVAGADGFSLNVSNFQTTSAEVAFGSDISQKLGGKHFVVDTARNGNGSNGEWCNPSGRAIGEQPTFSTGHSLVDAYLWLKTPGESDGTCNGGPSAGVWWPDYALSLVRNSQ